MSRARKLSRNYICDQCGRQGVGRKIYEMGDTYTISPEEWGTLLGKDLCDKCFGLVRVLIDIARERQANPPKPPEIGFKDKE